MVDLISQQPGGAKLGEQYVPLDAGERDFLPIVQDIRARQPDFVFSTLVGDSAAAFYRAYAEAGIDPRKSPIASLTTSEVELEQMGHAVAAGHFTSSPYFQSVDSEVNRRCIRRLKARFGDDAVASMLWEAAYFRCICLPTRSPPRAASGAGICCRTCWAPSSTRPRDASRSIRRPSTPACIRASAALPATAASSSCAKPPGACIPIPIWSRTRSAIAPRSSAT